jgi:ABC-type spermidine/putrescine transport system permease subunit I
MENSENKNSTRAILLGVIFVFLGFLCAFILFKFFTGPKHVPVSNLIAAIEQKKTNVPEAQPLVVEQTIVEEKQDSESVEQKKSRNGPR